MEGGREASLGGRFIGSDLGALVLQPRHRASCASFPPFAATLVTHRNITRALKKGECLKGGGRGGVRAWRGQAWGFLVTLLLRSAAPPPSPRAAQQRTARFSLLNIHAPWLW